MGLTFSRKTAKNLAVSRKNILSVKYVKPKEFSPEK